MNKLLRDLGLLLTEEQIQGAAKVYDIPYASLKAVIKVESLGTGFYKDTLIPIVRFENHIFSRYTKGIYDDSHPNLSSANFTNKYNLKGIAEFHRFLLAYNLDRVNAVLSTSWGIGQVMGFNHIYALGCEDNPFKFVDQMFKDERSQLYIMLDFIKENNLLKHLKTQDWNAFALGYNGKAYKKNNYHIKLAAYYNEFS